MESFLYLNPAIVKQRDFFIKTANHEMSKTISHAFLSVVISTCILLGILCTPGDQSPGSVFSPAFNDCFL